MNIWDETAGLPPFEEGITKPRIIEAMATLHRRYGTMAWIPHQEIAYQLWRNPDEETIDLCRRLMDEISENGLLRSRRMVEDNHRVMYQLVDVLDKLASL
jgi:hypothetical protein